MVKLEDLTDEFGPDSSCYSGNIILLSAHLLVDV